MCLRCWKPWQDLAARDKLAYAAAPHKPPGSPRQGGGRGCTYDTWGLPPEDAWFQREMAWVLRPQHPPAGPESRMGRQRAGRLPTTICLMYAGTERLVHELHLAIFNS